VLNIYQNETENSIMYAYKLQTYVTRFLKYVQMNDKVDLIFHNANPDVKEFFSQIEKPCCFAKLRVILESSKEMIADDYSDYFV